MVKIGRYNTLPVTRIVDFGVYLDGGNGVEILLPARYIDAVPAVGDEIDVFVYTDSEDRLIATTEHPYAQVGEFAFLDVVAVNRIGAFLDWGLMKDLLVPFSQQKVRMAVGMRCPVYVYLDDASKRVVASAKIEKFLGNVLPDYRQDQPVKALVYKRTPLGYACVVDNLHQGMLYENELFQPVEPGVALDAFVKRQRPDGKLDLTLSGNAKKRTADLSSKILDYLVENGGRAAIGDKSSPDEIKSLFKCSKKDFKKAVGHLLKDGAIAINENDIYGLSILKDDKS